VIRLSFQTKKQVLTWLETNKNSSLIDKNGTGNRHTSGFANNPIDPKDIFVVCAN